MKLGTLNLMSAVSSFVSTLLVFTSFVHVAVDSQSTQSNKYVYAQYSLNGLKSLTNDKSFSSTSSKGWQLQSIQNSDGTQSMFWESCDAQNSNHRSRLTTPLINKGDSSQNLRIKISFLVWCSSLSSNCNEEKLRGEVVLGDKYVSFDVQISQAHRGSIRSKRPPFPPYSTVIPVSVDVPAFQLRFSDEGLCIRISEIQIYSTFCPSEVKGLAYYPKTFAPQAPAEPIPIFGRCVTNSSPDPDVHLSSTQHCASFGQWTDSFSTCQCNPGFHANENKTACHQCGVHTYKSEYGNALRCNRCPTNSDSQVIGAGRCVCNQGYFRNTDHEPESMSCATSPSAPRDPSYDAEFTTAVVRWSPPEFNGGRDLIWYRVECPQCDNFLVEDNVRQPILTLTRLEPGSKYDVIVYSLNSVSKYYNRRNYTKIEVRTKEAIMPKDVTVANTNPGEVRLFWVRPDNFRGHTYCVRITAPGLSDTSEPRCVNRTLLVLNNLEGGTYGFEVGAVVSRDLPIVYSKKQFTQVTETAQLVEVTQKQLILVVAMMSVICFLFILLCSCAVMMYRRQNTAHSFDHDKQFSPYGNYGNGAHTLMSAYPASYMSGNSSPPMMIGPDGSAVVDGRMVPIGQAFIEPAFYEDIKQMVSEFCHFVDPCEVQIENPHPKEILSTYGELSVGYIDSTFSKNSYQNMNGSFSSPCEPGTVGGGSKVPVFIKSVALGDCQLRSFAIEASTMSQFRHPNVQLIYGISCMDSNWNLLTEMCEVGNLALYMGAALSSASSRQHQQSGPNSGGDENKRASPTPQLNKELLAQFVHFLRGISCGMQYLADVGYVHKVLTSANVKLNGNLVCKIAGFDHRVTLDESVSMSSDWQQLMDFLTPWCAPEVLQSGKYSSASDVWSFAVIAWELMNCMTLSSSDETTYNSSNNQHENTQNTSKTSKSSPNRPNLAKIPNNRSSPQKNLTSTFSAVSSDHIYSTTSNAPPISNSEHGEQISSGENSNEVREFSPSPGPENISLLVPYADMTQHRILDFLSNGKRLPIPSLTPKALGKLISDCWSGDRNCRPVFAQLRENLETFMRQPRLWDMLYDDSASSAANTWNESMKSNYGMLQLADEKKPMFSNYSSSYIGTLPRPLDSLITVDQWLMQHNFFVYRNMFASNHIYELHELLNLETTQLKKMGIESKKDRKAILNAIQLLKDRLLSAPTETLNTINSHETSLNHIHQQPSAKITFTSPVHSLI